MSDIKFSFEGPIHLLAQMLRGISAASESPEPAGTHTAPPILPRHVSEQLAPPPTPQVAPPQFVRGSTPEASTMEPLRTDEVYDHDGISSNPAPTHYPAENPTEGKPDFDFASLPLDEEAWAAFVVFVSAWMVGFGAPLDEKGQSTVEQPDRLLLLKGMGSGRWAIHILRWCAHYGSLQGAVAVVLGAPDAEAIDLVDRVSANISQVAHAAFPDIVGFHDHSTKWRRELAS
jgi:hypothetical protein